MLAPETFVLNREGVLLLAGISDPERWYAVVVQFGARLHLENISWNWDCLLTF